MKHELITIEILRSTSEIEKRTFYNFRIIEKINTYHTDRLRTLFYNAKYRNQTGNTQIKHLEIAEVLQKFITEQENEKEAKQ